MLSWYNISNNKWRLLLNLGIQNVSAPGRTKTFYTIKHTMFPDKDQPENKCAFDKGKLLDLLLTDILNMIDMWFFGFKHCENFTAVVVQINSPRNTIL